MLDARHPWLLLFQSGTGPKQTQLRQHMWSCATLLVQGPSQVTSQHFCLVLLFGKPEPPEPPDHDLDFGTSQVGSFQAVLSLPQDFSFQNWTPQMYKRTHLISTHPIRSHLIPHKHMENTLTSIVAACHQPTLNSQWRLSERKALSFTYNT